MKVDYRWQQCEAAENCHARETKTTHLTELQSTSRYAAPGLLKLTHVGCLRGRKRAEPTAHPFAHGKGLQPRYAAVFLPAEMSGLNAALKNMVHREPIVLWSCAIGLTGLLLPLIVPPIREAMYKPESRNPPSVQELVNKGKVSQA